MRGRVIARVLVDIGRRHGSNTASFLKGVEASARAHHCHDSIGLALERAGARTYSSAAVFPKIVRSELAGSLCRPRLILTGLLRKAHGAGKGCHLSTVSSTFAPLAGHAAVSIREVEPLVKGGGDIQRKVGIWLFGCTGWVFSMVVLGGVTRLTRSGLSMTDWKFAGSLPPLTEEQWQMEFAKYRKSPEYVRVNNGMTLDQFKFIYWMEYAHRMWGRALGLVFAGPFAYFFIRGYLTTRLALRLTTLMTMGAAQGLVGWWMVKSGLEEPETEYAQPRVSPYRLAAHLTSAFVIYSGLFWTALSVVFPEPPPVDNATLMHASVRVRRLALPVAALIGLTAISGAFVAGNDAGHAFNTFPKMGDHWIPDGLMEMKPFFRNFFENAATVQLDHRILATTTLISIAGMWAATRRLTLRPRVCLLINSALGMTALQVTLGISTLLMYVPVSLGAAHQAGALTLFTIILALVHSLRRPSSAALKTLTSDSSLRKGNWKLATKAL